MEDSHFRSIVKGITWRLMGTIDTIVISFIITGHLLIAIKIGGVEVVTKIILFYFHERLWGRLKWQKKINNKSDNPK